MPLGEAIKISTKELENHPYHKSTPFYRACKLGIEALEIIQEIRTCKNLDTLVSTTLDDIFKHLPSETEEGK